MFDAMSQRVSRDIANRVEPVERECAWCGTKFLTRDRRKTVPLYCRPYHRALARRARGVDDVTRTCPQCGEDFAVNKYLKVKYCSHMCGCLSRRRKENEDV